VLPGIELAAGDLTDVGRSPAVAGVDAFSRRRYDAPPDSTTSCIAPPRRRSAR
jgi:hypothetical protein